MRIKSGYRIAFLLYTSGIDYDDRIRKEMLSVMKLYPNVSFKIFAVEPRNRDEEGISSYGIPYRIPYLKSRDKYASATHTVAKAWDFYKSVRRDLKAFDAVWCADTVAFFFLLMIKKKPIVWDLHELPGRLMYNRMLKIFFRFLERKVTVVIHANEPRFKYLQSLGLIKHPRKHFFLRNYPDFNEIDAEYDAMYHSFEKWLEGDECVYLQGIVGTSRADMESIGAVLSFPELKGVVVGQIEYNRMKEFERRFGKEELEKRIFFTGQIKQLKTPQYIRECAFGLVFYKNMSANNWYCEPNRMFQIIINGKPVIVGNNPTMKDYVEKGGYGIVAETDGEDQNAIEKAIQILLRDYDEYKKNVSNTDTVWNSQEDTINLIMKKIIRPL